MRKLIIALCCLTVLLLLAAGAEVELTQYVIGQGYKAQLKGSVDAKSSITACIYNERTMSNDFSATVSAEEGINGINAKLLKYSVKIGEKKMLVYADDELVYEAAFYVPGEPADPVSLTGKCELSANGDTSRLRDGSINSTLKIGKEGLKVKLPDDLGSGQMMLEWRHPPKSATVHYYDGQLNEIGTSVIDNGFYVSKVEFGSNIKYLFVETDDPEGSLADVFVYERGNVPTPAQQWTEIERKLDILFVSTHQDDEFLFFGGAIPYYSNLGKNTAVAYTADCGIKRYYEALSALWVSGLKNHPIFMGYADFKPGSVGEAERKWARQGDPLGDLVIMFRKYKPDVVVTQDVNGEYGHYQHIYTVQLVTEAVKLAADENYYPESVQEFGTWQVKKYYVHLYKQNIIHVNWNVEVPGLGGISAIDLAKVAYNRNQSQLNDFTMEKQGSKYDNTWFGLAYSAVGEDVNKNDFFENID